MFIDEEKIKTVPLSNENPDTRFETISRIGWGSFGNVFRCKDRATGQIVAVKQIPINHDEDLDNVAKEIKIMKLLSHKNVVSYQDAYRAAECLWIAMEYCSGGSIDFIFKTLKQPLPEIVISYACREILQGLVYLHSKRTTHRDIKSGNILISADGGIKLADFGVSAQLTQTMSKHRTVGKGTFHFLSPEAIMESTYDSKADVWSLGITLIEMAEMEPPYASYLLPRLMATVTRDPPPTLQKQRHSWSPEFHRFLAKCLVKDPDQRPTAAELLKDPFVTTVNGEASSKELLRLIAAARSAAAAAAENEDRSSKNKNNNNVSSSSPDRQQNNNNNDDSNNNNDSPVPPAPNNRYKGFDSDDDSLVDHGEYGSPSENAAAAKNNNNDDLSDSVLLNETQNTNKNDDDSKNNYDDDNSIGEINNNNKNNVGVDDDDDFDDEGSVVGLDDFDDDDNNNNDFASRHRKMGEAEMKKLQRYEEEADDEIVMQGDDDYASEIQQQSLKDNNHNNTGGLYKNETSSANNSINNVDEFFSEEHLLQSSAGLPPQFLAATNLNNNRLSEQQNTNNNKNVIPWHAQPLCFTDGSGVAQIPILTLDEFSLDELVRVTHESNFMHPSVSAQMMKSFNNKQQQQQPQSPDSNNNNDPSSESFAFQRMNTASPTNSANMMFQSQPLGSPLVSKNHLQDPPIWTSFEKPQNISEHHRALMQLLARDNVPSLRELADLLHQHQQQFNNNTPQQQQQDLNNNNNGSSSTPTNNNKQGGGGNGGLSESTQTLNANFDLLLQEQLLEQTPNPQFVNSSTLQYGSNNSNQNGGIIGNNNNLSTGDHHSNNNNSDINGNINNLNENDPNYYLNLQQQRQRQAAMSSPFASAVPPFVHPPACGMTHTTETLLKLYGMMKFGVYEDVCTKERGQRCHGEAEKIGTILKSVLHVNT